METYSWILEEKNIVASFLRKDVVCVCACVCCFVLQKAERWETRIRLSIQLHQCAFVRNYQEKERAQEAYINRVIGDAPWQSQHFREMETIRVQVDPLAKNWRSPRSIGSLKSRHSCNELYGFLWAVNWALEGFCWRMCVIFRGTMEGYCWVLLPPGLTLRNFPPDFSDLKY